MITTTIQVSETESGSSSLVEIETTDRPGLLVDIVHTLKDLNVNVVSAEVDTEGVHLTLKPWTFVTLTFVRVALTPLWFGNSMPILMYFAAGS